MIEEPRQKTDQMDKQEIVCPLSLKLGVVQNYRCAYRATKGWWESRPVVGTDKWAGKFYEILRKSKDEGGLGKEDAQAFRFTHEDGVKARAQAIEKVNEGEIRAPKKGWDAKFVPQGGIPLEQLKEKFPEVYNSGKKIKAETHIEDEDLARQDLDHEQDAADKDEEQIKAKEEISEVLSPDEMAEVMDGEGAYEEAEAFGAEALATDSESATATGEEMEAQPDEVELKIPHSAVTTLHAEVFKFGDDPNETHWYKVKHPRTGRLVPMKEGINIFEGLRIKLTIQH